MTLVRVVVDRFLRRSGSRVSILNACRHEVPLALSLRVTPIPSRTTQESTRPRASDRPMCCQPGNRHGLPASDIDRRRRYSIKMQPRWNHARSAAQPNSSSHAQGLEGKEISSPSGRGRKMSLTSPLIEQALALIDPGLPRKQGFEYSYHKRGVQRTKRQSLWPRL
jgi:hypothetical protein